MAGKIITVLPKTTIDYSGLGVGQFSSLMALGPPLQTIDYTAVGIAVRVHSLNITSPLSNIIFGVYADGFIDFNNFAFPGPELFVVQVNNNFATPYALFGRDTALGEYASVMVQGQSGGGAALAATVSVDIYLRNPDPTTDDDATPLLFSGAPIISKAT